MPIYQLCLHSIVMGIVITFAAIITTPIVSLAMLLNIMFASIST